MFGIFLFEIKILLYKFLEHLPYCKIQKKSGHPKNCCSFPKIYTVCFEFDGPLTAHNHIKT